MYKRRLAVLSILLLIVEPAFAGEEVRPARFGDFAAYWTAGRAWIEGRNPFDPAVVKAIEDREQLSQAFVIFNPPWVFVLLAPFSALPPFIAMYLWVGSQLLLSLALGVAIGRRVGLGVFPSVLLTISFVPIDHCLGMAQLSIFVLTGCVLYLHFIESRQPFRAGVALALAALKPHLVALVWLFLLVLGSRKDRIQVMAGLIFALTLASGIALAWQPNLGSHYQESWRNPPENAPLNYFCAAPSSWLREGARKATGQSPLHGVAFAPIVVVGVLFFAALLLQRPTVNERWMDRALLLSTLAAPYGWFYDHVLLLPIYFRLWGGCAHNWPPDSASRATMLLLIAWEVLLGAMLYSDASPRLYVWSPVLLAAIYLFRVELRNSEADPGRLA